MSHPSVDEILSGTEAARAHVSSCPACRQLAGLSAPVGGAAAAAAGDLADDLAELPLVERDVYGQWEEIRDGRGGMGRTFRVRDRRLGRQVAIKQLLEPDAPAFREPGLRAGFRRRFEQEARLTARLQHPAIVGVHEAGRFPDGEPFFAMPLVHGAPLGEEIARRRSVAERLGLLPHVTALCEAVAYAHGQGIIHRDIKPDNVLIGPFGETVLIDWGLAKDLADVSREEPGGGVYREPAPDDGLTQLGVGTPHYMPPEQARGEEPDVRVDVYALGATLYHTLAGVAPYGGADPSEARRQVRAGAPRPLAALAPDVPPELAGIVGRAMARAPGARFQTARELADELRRFQTGQLLLTRRYTPAQLLRHWLRRHRTVLRVVALALATIVGLAVVSVRRIVRERDRAELGERRAQEELQRAQGITASRLAAEPTRRLEALALAVRAVGPRAAAGLPPAPEAVQGLMDALTAGPALVELKGHRKNVTYIDVSPDATRLVTMAADGAVRVWDARSGRHVVTYRSTLTMPYYVRFAPRAAQLVVCGFDRDTEIWDLVTGENRRLATGEMTTTCEFLPDGRLVTAAAALELWEPSTGERRAAQPLPAGAARLAVSSTGLVAVATVDRAVHLWEPRSGALTHVADHQGLILALQFSPDGRQLATASQDGKVQIVDVAPGGAGPTLLLDAPDMPVVALRFSPDGRYLVVAHYGHPTRQAIARGVILDLANGGAPRTIAGGIPNANPFAGQGEHMFALAGARLVQFDTASGATLLQLTGHHDAINTLLYFADGPDGGRLASASSDSAAYLWDLRTGVATGFLPAHTGEITAAALAGDALLTASLDGTARLWDLATGRSRAVVQGPSELLGAALAPDGRRAVTTGLDGVARVYGADGQLLATLGAPGAPLTFAAFSPEGGRVLTAGLDGAVVIWDAATGAPLQILRGAGGAATAAAFSPDGTRVASGYADGGVRLWDAMTGRALGALPTDDPNDHNGVASVFFTPDGARLLVARPTGRTLVARAADLTVERTLEGRPASVQESPFSADGRRLVAVTGDGRVLVHDLAGGPPVSLEGHTQLVLSAGFAADGRRLVTGGMDGTVRLWDLAARTTVFTIGAGVDALGEVTAAKLSPDGRWIVAAHSTGALRLHPATVESALARACGVLDWFDRGADAGGYCP